MGFRKAELATVGKGRRSASHQRTFSGKIKCGECGSWYGSKTWHSGSKYEKRVWRCNHKYRVETVCSTPHLRDKQIEEAFIAAVHQLLTERDHHDDVLETELLRELDTTDLRIQADQIAAGAAAVGEAIEKVFAEITDRQNRLNAYRLYKANVAELRPTSGTPSQTMPKSVLKVLSPSCSETAATQHVKSLNYPRGDKAKRAATP